MLTSWTTTVIMKRDCGNILAMQHVLRGHLPDIETASNTTISVSNIGWTLTGHDWDTLIAVGKYEESY